MAVKPIESKKGGDISPINHSPQDDQCGPGVERTDEVRAEADKAMEEDFQEDHHDPEAASSGDISHDTSPAPSCPLETPARHLSQRLTSTTRRTFPTGVGAQCA